ncbi:hypothetical protein BOTBODRAFT_25572 [Botryobasidium botryosum FD-172 SS1]|uniref:Arginine N-methyltransferase 2 n=1 Tax=Botryobasidium botryosum (strain FD-172 SS1) TaxID=930990 RepID=A0A067MZG4_BOTB1|nr:hypothetical protein BOTBODRAFT_25572 [Botryobasidium botryosum FD-172 SS1]
MEKLQQALSSGQNTADSGISEEELEVLLALGDSLFAACQANDYPAARSLIESGAPVWYEDPEKECSVLHAAAEQENEELVEYLIEKGAIWNAVDGLGNTAADIALSLNNEACYRIIRDAGIRSEFLLSVLKSRSQDLASVFLKAEDSTAAGSSETYLASQLRYTADENGQEICLVETSPGEEVGVMMGWEKPIMGETVRLLCDGHENYNQGISVLNIGFGLGIIDTLFQSLSVPPQRHVICEAHPDVLSRMREKGWYDKPGVVVLEGKWQSFVDNEELYKDGGFDVVYTDTFSEDYSDLRQFFEQVPNLLKGPGSRFSFFNGLGATNPTFYDVYTNLAELHLSDIGLKTSWSDVDVHAGAEHRWGKTRDYFSLPLYRLPICEMD